MDWKFFFLGLLDGDVLEAYAQKFEENRYNLSCFLGWWWCPALPSVGILFLNCKYYFTYCIETIVFEYIQASIQWVTKKGTFLNVLKSAIIH